MSLIVRSVQGRSPRWMVEAVQEEASLTQGVGTKAQPNRPTARHNCTYSCELCMERACKLDSMRSMPAKNERWSNVGKFRP